MTVLALIGAKALWLLYAWLASAMQTATAVARFSGETGNASCITRE